MHFFKKAFLIFSFFSILNACIFAQADSLPKISENVLENGLSVYVLEDFSTPLVRIQFVVRAGFAHQTPSNTGFFKLYTSLFADTLNYPLENFECLSDASTFSVLISPSEVPKFLEQLSEVAFNPRFSDAQIKTALSSMKKQVLDNAEDPASLINQAIDSRVFSVEPWKHDSGVYPALFTGTTNAQARAILSTISENYYVPQNSAIFISGNINQNEVLSLIDDSFGRYYKGNYIPKSLISTSTSENRKFVILSDDFSPDFVQLVYQWTSLSAPESDMAACLYNNDYSSWKQTLLADESLLCTGSDYINAASAEKSGTTRFIVQALLETGSQSPAIQAQTFLTDSLQAFPGFSSYEYENALYNMYSAYTGKIKSDEAFMETLAQYWIRENSIGNPSSSLTEVFQNDLLLHLSTSSDSFTQKLCEESPFQFVLVNSSLYKKHEKSFKNLGYEPVNQKNASWWQTSLSGVLEKNEEKPFSASINTGEWWMDFYTPNKESIKSGKLKNGISLVAKTSENSLSRLVFKIDGGSVYSAKNPGFEEVMINLLATSVTSKIYEKQIQYLVAGNFDIYADTGLNSSSITLEFDSEDFGQIVKCFYEALVFSEILPSDADRAVSAARTKNRLRKGSTVNQLYSALIKKLYSGTDVSAVYSTKDEILTNINYDQILEAYPILLDASRYSIFYQGNISFENARNVLEDTFGNLRNTGDFESGNLPDNQMPSVSFIKVPVIHTFLTDVSARDAGPRPAVLVPTKEFTDPVLYTFFPSKNTKLCHFNAVLFYLGQRLQKEMELSELSECVVQVSQATENLPFGTLIVTNVSRTGPVDSLLQKLLVSVSEEMTVIMDFEKTTREIKNAWTKNIFTRGKSHAELLAENIDYLEDYLDVHLFQNEDYLEVINNCFTIDSCLTVYSADSKK